MNYRELSTYLDRTVEEAFEYYCSQANIPEKKARDYKMTQEQMEHWNQAVALLADTFEDAVRNISWERDERDI